MALKYAICLIVLLGAACAFADNPAPVSREEHRILIDGIEELWRLEWARPPKPVCAPEDDYWMTCPCSGFAFGEYGDLVLVRKRPGQADERFELNRFFEDAEAPSPSGEAVLRRWDVHDKDMDETESPDFASRVRARPNARTMSFQDYDHDGRATEFLLQIGTEPCGKNMCVAVGISHRTPHLHVFKTAAHPERPLVLQAWQWEALLQAKGPITVIDRKFGDHSFDGETELELSVDEKGIHATRITHECDENGRRLRISEKQAL